MVPTACHTASKIMNNQGKNASKLFSGKSEIEPSKLLYSESADLFSNIIKDEFEPGNYNLADLGGHKGEFLFELLKKLPNYNINSIIIDTVEGVENDFKIEKRISDIVNTGLSDKSIDILIVRYVLAWNTIEKQKEILKEIVRICRGICIIQHQGTDKSDSLLFQKNFGELIPKIKRNEGVFTNPLEIQNWIEELQIKYRTVQNRKIIGLSDIAIEKYGLDSIESEKIKELLLGRDYILQTTWLLDFRKED